MSAADDLRDGRVGRLLSELLDRRARGEPVSEDEFLRAHPELADEVRANLALLGDFALPADTLAALIDRGWLTPAAESTYAARLGPYQILELLGHGGMGMC